LIDSFIPNFAEFIVCFCSKREKEDAEFLAIAKAACSLILELMPQKVKVSALTCTYKVDLFKIVY